tara:strand:- start:512 stop:733 length:222 start_codon:yes stop_codon:yes gene_type:complete
LFEVSLALISCTVSILPVGCFVASTTGSVSIGSITVVSSTFVGSTVTSGVIVESITGSAIGSTCGTTQFTKLC